jgi:hypothetical protein
MLIFKIFLNPSEHAFNLKLLRVTFSVPIVKSGSRLYECIKTNSASAGFSVFMVEKLRRIVLLFCRDCLSRVAFGCSRVAFGWVALPRLLTNVALG